MIIPIFMWASMFIMMSHHYWLLSFTNTYPATDENAKIVYEVSSVVVISLLVLAVVTFMAVAKP